MEALCLPLSPHPLALSSLWLFLSCNLYNETIILSIALSVSSVNFFCELLNLKEYRGNRSSKTSASNQVL